MITIVSYGLGNVRAFANVYDRLGVPVTIANDAASLRDAERLILPGVGAFDQAMTLLNQSGMRETLDELVRERHVPVLGVCVGMQMMASGSEEGALPGLGWIPGEVRRLRPVGRSNTMILPHMGWNDVTPVAPGSLFAGLEREALFYFLHSFAFECANDVNVLAEADYGHRFTSAVHNDNAYGVQFHPEKSHHFGMRLLQNFAGI
jgi:imidazole glycerol-phosphate synthase subunit HisH